MSFTALSYDPLPLATPIYAPAYLWEKDNHNEILKAKDDFSNTNDMDGYKLADTPLPSPVFNPTRIQFRVSVNEDKAEEIIMYNKMLEYITRDEESDIMWKFQKIISHEVQGSKITLLIEWENGGITKEPLSIIAVDDPVTCAIYASENGLLNQPGWKRFKHIAKKFTYG
jgi:hypothetical protein